MDFISLLFWGREIKAHNISCRELIRINRAFLLLECLNDGLI
jgi:hypothetical protein